MAEKALICYYVLPVLLCTSPVDVGHYLRFIILYTSQIYNLPAILSKKEESKCVCMCRIEVEQIIFKFIFIYLSAEIQSSQRHAAL